MTKKISILTLALMVFIAAYGRDIKGQILNENSAPLDFVNVVLYCDSIYVAGGITDAGGNFSISAGEACGLTAKVAFVGYETRVVPVPADGNLGVIVLAPSVVALNEVVVKAARPSTVMKGNALVTTVEGSSLAIAGTAKDVLERVPMMIDNGGSLEVFGKGAPAIYINGRKVNDIQELSQLNSQDVKSVEVITNPGAAYSADVKSVVRIRTKPPKGDGWSGTLRTDNSFTHYFRTGNSIDLKYRTRGLEIFANYGWWNGHNLSDQTNDMTTSAPTGTYLQKIHTRWKEKYNDMNGKLGFSWLIDGRHSVGAYYRNGWNRHSMAGETPTEVWKDGALTEVIDTRMDNASSSLPMHSANIYYNGSVGKLGIDLNADYLWTKQRQDSYNNEVAEIGSDRIVATTSTNRSRMFAEKLVLSHPIWKGRIEVGEEYTDSRTSTRFSASISDIGNADTKVDESNMAVFAEVGQQLGRYSIGVGVRYEHVRYDYFVMGQHREAQSKNYDNLFPSLNVATRFGQVMMGIGYSSKTVRPGYGQLDGTVSYINRLTYETGNPYLKPTKMQTVEYMAQWRHLFAQLSYTCFKDGVYHVTEPYGEATLIKTANLSRRHFVQLFVGGQFKLGAWQPKVNAGVMKQWLTLPVNGRPTKMNTPVFLVQWQNAIHLPLDIWLNIDAQLMTPGWENNIKLTNTPWHVNAKFYKGFFNDAFSISLEAKDIFDTAKKNSFLCSDAVQIVQRNLTPGRSVMLTIQYRFNATRDRYRGAGAGNTEKSRF